MAASFTTPCAAAVIYLKLSRPFKYNENPSVPMSLTAGNWRLQAYGSFAGMNFVQIFVQIRPAVLELNYADGHTDLVGPICFHFVHIV
jgi:hypothetical protein